MPSPEAALEEDSPVPPAASQTGPPATRGLDPNNPPFPSDQPKSDDTPAPPYHRHIPITDARTGRPTGDNFTDQGQYGAPVVSASRTYYEPFIPTPVHYKNWGEDDPVLAGAKKYPGVLDSPYMPRERDMAGLLHGLVMWFGRYGSPHVGIPAIAMGTYASAYWTAYQKGMHERAGTAWQQYRQAQQVMLDRQKQELSEARQIMSVYSDDPNRLEQEMLNLSRKYGGDKYLEAAIAKGPAAMEAWLSAKNGKYLDAAKLKQTQDMEAERLKGIRLDNERKEKALRGEDVPEEWRDTPPGGKPTGGGASAEPDETTADTEPDTTEPDDTSEEDTRTASAAESDIAGGGTAPKSRPTTVAQAADTLAPNPNLNPRVKAAADEEVRGEKPPEGVPKAVLPKIAAEAERQKAVLDKMMNDGTITGQDPDRDLAAIRKVNPSLARDVESLGQYKRLVPTGGASMYANMENLTRAIYPHWDPSVYDWIRSFENEKSPDQQLLGRSATLAGEAEGVFRALRDVPENSRPIKNWIDYETGKILTGDPKWAAVGQSFYNFVFQSLSAQNGGTRPTVAAVKHEMELFPITMGPKAIRAMMAQTALADVHRMEHSKFVWEQKTNRKEDPTGYDAHAIGWLKAISDIDYTTGYPKPDSKNPVPDDMKPYLGPAGTNINKPKSNIPPAQIEAAREWLLDPKNANDPNRANIEKALGIR